MAFSTIPVVCLTLDKWETVSGQFGGYLKIPLLLHLSDSTVELFGRRWGDIIDATKMTDHVYKAAG